jgi:transposase InsO family protein
MSGRRPHLARKAARELALWRLGLIEPALAVQKGPERRKAVDRIARTWVKLPTGERKRVSRATLYRWIGAFEEKRSPSALEPRPRSDKGKTRARIPALVLNRALLYLARDPGITLPLLIDVISKDPEIVPILEKAGISRISKSTLQRRLASTKLYERMCRERKKKNSRRRWVPRRVHQVWHLDAKGPVTIITTSGQRLSFHIVSIIDGASRAVLAARLVSTPDLCATVMVFRTAVRKYGLPEMFYFDRASAFDTMAFRSGLAVLGIQRIFVRPRNPQPNGKIEAYHRCLSLWFVCRLKKQDVVDFLHLEQLFSAVIDYYQNHTNREIKTSPRDLLGGAMSSRPCPPGVALDEVFLQPYGELKTHRITGEIDVGGGRGKFLAPRELRGRRLEILVDPDPDMPVLARIPETLQLIPLERAQVHPKDAGPDPGPCVRWGRGVLQALYDNWRGKVRPVAEPGFGLNELYRLLSDGCGREVPRTEAEAGLVLHWLVANGPFTRKAVETALCAITACLGQGRPLKTYLDELTRRVVPSDRPLPPKSKRKRSS